MQDCLPELNEYENYASVRDIFSPMDEMYGSWGDQH